MKSIKLIISILFGIIPFLSNAQTADKDTIIIRNGMEYKIAFRSKLSINNLTLDKEQQKIYKESLVKPYRERAKMANAYWEGDSRKELGEKIALDLRPYFEDFFSPYFSKERSIFMDICYYPDGRIYYINYSIDIDIAKKIGYDKLIAFEQSIRNNYRLPSYEGSGIHYMKLILLIDPKSERFKNGYLNVGI